MRPSADRGRRDIAAIASLVAGGAISIVLLILGVTPGVVLIPVSVAFLVSGAIMPFPRADYLLAIGLLGTLPLLPPLGLPNLPLAAAVVALALTRVIAHRRSWPPLRSTLVVVGVWSFVLIGALISNWPPLGVWLRPAATLVIGLGAALLGLVVLLDSERRWRWIVGLTAGTLVVAVSGLVVFGLQYVISTDLIVDAVVASLGYLRGDAAATAFDALNNWRIRGDTSTILRAVSPLFPAPNSLGGYLGVGMPLAAALALNGTASRHARILGMVSLAASITALVVTYSRSSWLAAVIALLGVAIVAFVARRHSPVGENRTLTSARLPERKAVLRVAAIVLVAGAVGVGGVLTTANVRAWDRVVAATDDPSVQDRIEGDAAAVGRIQAGLLRGSGLGNWTGRAASDPPTRGEHTPYVHNLYLEYSGATGILGGIWVVLLFGVTIVGGASAALRGRSQGSTLAGLGLVAIGVYGATQGMFDDNFLNPQLCWLNAWAFGGAVALLRATRRPADDPAPD